MLYVKPGRKEERNQRRFEKEKILILVEAVGVLDGNFPDCSIKFHSLDTHHINRFFDVQILFMCLDSSHSKLCANRTLVLPDPGRCQNGD